MEATPQNMDTLRKQANAPICAPGVFAYSAQTGERFSASPGDYFACESEEPIRDANGEPMILARETSRVVAI